MRYTRKMRSIHLWTGIILSVFIIIEALTGLIQSEPWIIGATESEMHDDFDSFAHLTNSIHEGQISNVSFKLLIDITALGLIILTITGLYLSIPFLRRR